ncbi:hypothetical protein CRENBAI_008924 [Crenichthys baileyi]|uniref:Uncharacterized protein n=1 Tax=Crenichthys baileyi TaxID=28760 RepID=A0AAV9R4Y9_9TELE
MYPPLMNLADERQASAIDLWVQQQMVEALRNLSDVLKVLPSPLLLEEMDQEAAQHQGHQGGCLFLVPQLQLSLLTVLVSPVAPLAVRHRNHKAASTLVPWDLPDTSTPFCCLLEVLSPEPSSALHSRDSHATTSLFTSPAFCCRGIHFFLFPMQSWDNFRAFVCNNEASWVYSCSTLPIVACSEHCSSGPSDASTHATESLIHVPEFCDESPHDHVPDFPKRVCS